MQFGSENASNGLQFSYTNAHSIPTCFVRISFVIVYYAVEQIRIKRKQTVKLLMLTLHQTKYTCLLPIRLFIVCTFFPFSLFQKFELLLEWNSIMSMRLVHIHIVQFIAMKRPALMCLFCSVFFRFVHLVSANHHAAFSLFFVVVCIFIF